ncbi:MAG: cytochrome c oxidase subunit [Mycobacterium sp.]|jgi:heme/copper-type cytochrome/quinol oxidase subunit 4|nr:cytochrome c oxidase subunit [Mycobacterium sp.]MDT5239022.1 cytochrome c oxidase subunit [Mycobacterium sp.]
MVNNISQHARALQSTARYVGGALIALTLGSYLLGIDHLLGVSRTAMALVLVVAFAKVWLITSYFMDIRHAPRWLGALIHAWILITASLVIGLYIVL